MEFPTYIISPTNIVFKEWMGTLLGTNKENMLLEFLFFLILCFSTHKVIISYTVKGGE
jgi:hypothetical protein